MRAWMEGLFRWPRLLVVYEGGEGYRGGDEGLDGGLVQVAQDAGGLHTRRDAREGCRIRG